MIIKNRAELETTVLRKQALSIIEAGIRRVLPTTIMKSAVSYSPTSRMLTVADTVYSVARGRLFVIGGGKAAGLMAEALEDIIPSQDIAAGLVICKDEDYKTRKTEVVTAGHPIPDQRGVNAVVRMLGLKQKYNISKNDVVVVLISGGGSALMVCPADGVTLNEMQQTTELLLASMAEIAEVNTVRKHLSRVKGGRLGGYFAPAKMVSLILSDVVGDDLSVIASGPTFPDTTTFADAYRVLGRYSLLDRVPPGVARVLVDGCSGMVAETPERLTGCHHHIIGNNRLALEAMQLEANKLGFTANIVTDEQRGDTANVARSHAGEILASKYAGYNALIIGGETTPRLPDNVGHGGRNQHYAATSMLVLRDYPGQWLVASVGTDGTDFLPDVAGAIVDNGSLERARAMDIAVESYIDRYDSNTLFARLGNTLVVTGNTGTNVSDVILYLLG
jgi:glycerate-2-kinase